MSRPLPVRGEPALPPWIRDEEAAPRGPARDQGADAPREALDRLRGGALPEPHGVLRAEDRDVPHRGRRLHARVRLLPHRVGQARAARPARARAPRGRGARHGTFARRRDVRGPRRPRGRRLGALGRRRPRAEGRRAGAHGRGPDAGLPGGRGADRPCRGRRTRRLQPQRRDGPSPLRERPAEIGISPVRGSPRPRQGAPPGNDGEVRVSCSASAKRTARCPTSSAP